MVERRQDGSSESRKKGEKVKNGGEREREGESVSE